MDLPSASDLQALVRVGERLAQALEDAVVLGKREADTLKALNVNGAALASGLHRMAQVLEVKDAGSGLLDILKGLAKAAGKRR